jgi:hypothetical protein
MAAHLVTVNFPKEWFSQSDRPLQTFIAKERTGLKMFEA